VDNKLGKVAPYGVFYEKGIKIRDARGRVRNGGYIFVLTADQLACSDETP